MSKGSRQRPANLDRFNAEFDRIFGVKANPEQCQDFWCQSCGGRAIPEVVEDDSEMGFSVTTLTCEKCGSTIENECSTEELFGL